ncbi:hybrid sensor histidine kinase/response regulator transcription factor [Bacteroides sp.]|uniref:hybrid sensor histidine kinase/response regulator transcription factor n=1 Tax=Bacteroides sp. TaxID=29523 RepID=UPI0025C21A7E|nr:hybrid sensor histidine kinase/response regulator transcription factor [Bacteroides sp.]
MNILKLILLINIFAIGTLRAEYFRTIGVQEGLLHYSVNDIYQDVLGRMWFGTPVGIDIFDGGKITDIKVYDILDGYPMMKRAIRNFCADGSGNVYFTAADNLMKCDIRNNNLTWIKDKVPALNRCGDDILFVSNRIVYVLDSASQERKELLRLPFSSVNYLWRTGEGVWWFAASGGLYKYDGKEFKTIVADTDYRYILEDSNGEIWACSYDDGLFRILPQSDGVVVYNVRTSITKGFMCNNVRAVVEDRNKDLWIATMFGVFKFDRKDENFSLHSWKFNKGGLGHSSVYSVFIDRNETLWAGTYRGGVSYYRPFQDDYTYFGPSEQNVGFSHPVIGDMIETPEGELMVCTKGGGLNILDTQKRIVRKFETDRYPFHLPHTNLKSIYYDGKDDIYYIGTNSRNFYSFDLKRNSFRQIFKKEYIVHAMEKYGNTMYLSTDHGVYAYDILTKNEMLLYKFNMARSGFLLDSDKILWIPAGKWLMRYDVRAMEFQDSCLIKDIGLKHEIIYLYQHRGGDIYAATLNGGLYKYDSVSGRFATFTEDKDYFSWMSCYKIAGYGENRLVVTSSKGIIEVGTDGRGIKILQSWEDMPIEAVSEDCGLYVSRDSVVYVGGMNGMLAIKPGRNAPRDNAAKVNWADLYVGGNLIVPSDSSEILRKNLAFAEEVILKHNQNKIDIRFVLDNPTENIKDYSFEYRFDTDKEWYRANGNMVSYSNLSSGKYLLQIRGFKPGTDEAHMYNELKIRILPPWYFTWWAYVIWAAVSAVVILLLSRMFLRQKMLYASVVREKAEKEHLKNINEVKLRFFTSISHEFKTPLTLIVGQLESIIRNYSVQPVVHNKISKAIKQSVLLSNLITELIDFRKYEQNKIKLNVAEHDVNSFVSGALVDFKDQAALLDICLDVGADAGNPKAWFDAKEMTRVIYNLLSNALKYTSKGGFVHIDVSSDEKNVYVDVIDNGKGMNADDLRNIFERFYIADDNSKSMYFSESSGIGLALVKSIINMHGGSITVNSKKDYGSVFKVSLPLGNEHFAGKENVVIDVSRKEEAVAPKMPVETDVEEVHDMELKSADGTKPIVVLVEDNLELLEVLEGIFSVQYDVRTASDGIKGYEVIMDSKPDLVVSDVMMPGMNGRDLCKKIKNNIDTCHIPVVLLTALNREDQSMEGFLCGADDYIGKPFNSKLLLVRCNNIIRSRMMIRNKFESQTEVPINTLATNRLDKDFLDRIQSFMEDNLENSDFDIDVMPGPLGMSRTTFYSKFKKITGQTPNEFVMIYRLNKSVTLMKEHPEFTMAEVAYKLGFNTPNYFCKRFKDHFGISPAKYKDSSL